MDEKIIYIPREKLYAHPNNPRKLLGDCTEMADSIRAMGILQPLVVVRYNPSEHPTIQPDGEDCYVTIIGHRRRKGGMMAGVEAYPAILKEMTLSEQIGTMLVENGNREDLTRQEEAHAIQQLLDLGESIDSVCEMTGFSKETIRKRRKLLDLDQQKLAEAEARGGRLEDYMKLDKISDPELKNALLDTIGTNNFDAELKRARDILKRRELITAYVPEVEKFATRIEAPDSEKMYFLRNYNWWNRDPIAVPEDADQVAYFFRVTPEQIDFYRERSASEVERQDQARAAAQLQSEETNRRNQELEEVALRAYELRTEFVHNLSSQKVKKHFGAVVTFFGKCLLDMVSTKDARSLSLDTFLMGDMLGLDIDSAGIVPLKEYEESARRVPEYNLLVTAYLLADSNDLRYHQREYQLSTTSYLVKHIDNEKLDRVYALLTELGYKLSDEESAYKDGTHKLYDAVQEKAETNT